MMMHKSMRFPTKYPLGLQQTFLSEPGAQNSTLRTLYLSLHPAANSMPSTASTESNSRWSKFYHQSIKRNSPKMQWFSGQQIVESNQQKLRSHCNVKFVGRQICFLWGEKCRSGYIFRLLSTSLLVRSADAPQEHSTGTQQQRTLSWAFWAPSECQRPVLHQSNLSNYSSSTSLWSRVHGHSQHKKPSAQQRMHVSKTNPQHK